MVRIDLEVVKEWVTKIQSYFFPTLYTPTPGLTLIHFREIWDGFCNKVISDRFDQLNTFPTYFPHFWTWLLNTIAITPKSEDKYVVKVFNWSEFHLSEMTLLQNPYFNKTFQKVPIPHLTITRTMKLTLVKRWEQIINLVNLVNTKFG